MHSKVQVAKVINEWDPVGFLAGGAPENEYDIEIREIDKQIHFCNSAIELAKLIQTVFYDYLCIKLNSLDCCKHAFIIYNEMESEPEIKLSYD